jgi:glyoxylase-like metal-dependent hydrolase (beta-lactamase superfamily II)
MRQVAPDVFLLDGFPSALINVYLIGTKDDFVLLDAGTKMAIPGLLRQLRTGLQGRKLTGHTLTHAHPDHQGASHAICEAFGVPLWCGSVDAPAVESGNLFSHIPPNTLNRIINALWTGPAHPVARGLVEGDTVAGFTVIDAPGHSPGQVAYWRESDKVLILGDVARNVNFLTLQTELGEPPEVFTLDIPKNRDSARKLAALQPRLVCFGHGQPLTDGARFVDAVARWP